MVRLIQLHVFDSNRKQLVQCEDEPLHIVAAPGCFIVSTAAGILNVYQSDTDCKLLFSIKTKGKEIWDLQYSQFDDSLVTIENESADSAIRVVRQYANWRGLSTPTGPSAVVVNELVASRSIRMLAVDSSLSPPKMTTADAYRRPQPFPFFNILVATDGLVSLYRVRCYTPQAHDTSSSTPILQESQTATNAEVDLEASFTWVFSIKAQASRIGLCDSYFSYTTSTEVFLLQLTVDQLSMEQKSLSQLCKTSIDSAHLERQRIPHHSIVLATTTLKRVKEAIKRGGSGISRSSSFAAANESSGSLHLSHQGHSSHHHQQPQHASSSGHSLSRASSMDASKFNKQQTPSTLGRPTPDFRDSVELSKHHYDIIFDKSNAIKDKAPYVELSLETRNAQVIGTTPGLPVGVPMTPNKSSISNLGQIVGPHQDVHAYSVNTEDDFVITSSQLLFYHNFAIVQASLDGDTFVAIGESTDSLESESATINSLHLLPVMRTSSHPGTSEADIQVGVKIFVGTATQGHLWMLKNQEVCESATYTFLSECYKTIVTDQFLYSLTHTNTVLIHLMRQLDSHHSGSQYAFMQGEAGKAKSARTNGSKRPQNPPDSSVSAFSLRLKTLVQQRVDPLLVGAMDFMGLTHICANVDGQVMVLCKSTEDQIAALRDASLAGAKRRPRTASNPTGTSSPGRRGAALGWNLISTKLHSVNSMLGQFRNWIGPAETLSKDDWSILLENWTLASSVISSLKRPRNPRQIVQWASQEDLEPAIAAKRSIYGKLAHLEFLSNRFMRAAILWSISDVPVSQAIKKLTDKLKSGQKEAASKLTEEACVELLRRVLLGSSQRMDLIEQGSPGFADVVYAILVMKNAPLVGQVVLESPLDNFTLDETIILLEQTMEKLEGNVQRTSEVVTSFLTSAVVLDTDGEIQGKASPLNDFYQTQTLEERQLWMTTLALVVLMLRRGDGEALLARRNASFKGSLHLTTPDVYLFKLPEAFLVPYLTTHSHLMFDNSMAARHDSTQDAGIGARRNGEIGNDAVPVLSSGSAESTPSNFTATTAPYQTNVRRPSKLALLLAQTRPWTCLEILVVAGASVFSSSFSQDLMATSAKDVFPWLKFSLANHIHGLGSESAPASPSPPSELALESETSVASHTLNSVLFTAYLEAQILKYLNPSPKVPLSRVHPSAVPPNSNKLGSTTLTHSEALPVTVNEDGEQIPSDWQRYVQDIKLLSSRYINQINMPIEELSTHLAYVTPDLVLKTNPHNTVPAVSLEGIWKEFHREYLLDSRYKFIMNVPPVIPPIKGPGYHQQLPEHFYLFKLQGLLCALTEKATKQADLASRLPEIALHIINELESAQIPAALQDSVRLLCSPIQGDFESTVVQLVQHHPKSLIRFLKKYLPLRDMEKWRTTLKVLLLFVTKADAVDATWCLEETLKHMARHLSSENFLNLLPANGNAAFFIPYIELNLGRNASMNLLAQLQALK